LALGDVDRVDRNYSVGLIREEPRRVVRVNDHRSREDTLSGSTRKQRNWLIQPGIEILTGGMAPMLVACYVGCWVICESLITLL
jgi:hypothetical protein